MLVTRKDQNSVQECRRATNQTERHSIAQGYFLLASARCWQTGLGPERQRPLLQIGQLKGDVTGNRIASSRARQGVSVKQGPRHTQRKKRSIGRYPLLSTGHLFSAPPPPPTATSSFPASSLLHYLGTISQYLSRTVILMSTTPPPLSPNPPPPRENNMTVPLVYC